MRCRWSCCRVTVVQVDRSIEVVRDALVLSLTRSSRPSLPRHRCVIFFPKSGVAFQFFCVKY